MLFRHHRFGNWINEKDRKIDPPQYLLSEASEYKFSQSSPAGLYHEAANGY
jgi:hypothetical protein